MLPFLESEDPNVRLVAQTVLGDTRGRHR